MWVFTAVQADPTATQVGLVAKKKKKKKQNKTKQSFFSKKINVNY